MFAFGGYGECECGGGVVTHEEEVDVKQLICKILEQLLTVTRDMYSSQMTARVLVDELIRRARDMRQDALNEYSNYD